MKRPCLLAVNLTVFCVFIFTRMVYFLEIASPYSFRARAVKPLFAALGCQPTIQRVFYQRDDAPAQVALLVDGSAAASSSSSSAAVGPSSH